MGTIKKIGSRYVQMAWRSDASILQRMALVVDMRAKGLTMPGIRLALSKRNPPINVSLRTVELDYERSLQLYAEEIARPLPSLVAEALSRNDALFKEGWRRLLAIPANVDNSAAASLLGRLDQIDHRRNTLLGLTTDQLRARLRTMSNEEILAEIQLLAQSAAADQGDAQGDAGGQPPALPAPVDESVAGARARAAATPSDERYRDEARAILVRLRQDDAADLPGEPPQLAPAGGADPGQ